MKEKYQEKVAIRRLHRLLGGYEKKHPGLLIDGEVTISPIGLNTGTVRIEVRRREHISEVEVFSALYLGGRWKVYDEDGMGLKKSFGWILKTI